MKLMSGEWMNARAKTLTREVTETIAHKYNFSCTFSTTFVVERESDLLLVQFCSQLNSFAHPASTRDRQNLR